MILSRWLPGTIICITWSSVIPLIIPPFLQNADNKAPVWMERTAWELFKPFPISFLIENQGLQTAFSPIGGGGEPDGCLKLLAIFKHKKTFCSALQKWPNPLCLQLFKYVRVKHVRKSPFGCSSWVLSWIALQGVCEGREPEICAQS